MEGEALEQNGIVKLHVWKNLCSSGWCAEDGGVGVIGVALETKAVAYKFVCTLHLIRGL